ncbi:hypothetical protein GGS20DRAFT_556612 [Poronia punctata]|nr:hypothetical protein GGS20DRAFT_556612 [Poronia punctata]
MELFCLRTNNSRHHKRRRHSRKTSKEGGKTRHHKVEEARGLRTHSERERNSDLKGTKKSTRQMSHHRPRCHGDGRNQQCACAYCFLQPTSSHPATKSGNDDQTSDVSLSYRGDRVHGKPFVVDLPIRSGSHQKRERTTDYYKRLHAGPGDQIYVHPYSTHHYRLPVVDYGATHHGVRVGSSSSPACYMALVPGSATIRDVEAVLARRPGSVAMVRLASTEDLVPIESFHCTRDLYEASLQLEIMDENEDISSTNGAV